MSVDLPRYRCHKVVQAVKIAVVRAVGTDIFLDTDDPTVEPIPVSATWMVEKRAHAGGYYVRYEDGYSSFSPAEVFEAGYTRIE